MESEATLRVTEMLRAWSAGDSGAANRLAELIYPELRKMARSYMRKERAGQTLQTTALIHEAYLRLAHAGASWQDRRHFFATAATVMRRILVDEARARNSVKRGGAFARVEHSAAFEFDKVPDLNSYRPGSLVQLDDALTALAQIDARGAAVVELRFFGGFSVEETAEVLGVSPQTVMRDWKLAKGWLVRELSK